MLLTSFKYKTRKGPDYRHGEQVPFIDIRDTFGIGSIRVGKWVNQEEKDLAANLIFDSFADLAYILALPQKAYRPWTDDYGSNQQGCMCGSVW